MKQCWICGKPATTGEHKIKRRDLARVHGETAIFTRAGLNYLTSDGEVVPLQGPNSRYLKDDNVLCAACNNSTSQPYDRAYDRFIDFMDGNTATLLARRQLNFAEIYGPNWRDEQPNLFKYFVKALGCRIADSGRPVPEDLRLVFQDQYPQQSFAICLAVDEAEIAKPPEARVKLAIGHLILNEPSTAAIRFSTAGRYRWLLISYWYNWGPYGPMGEPWHRDQQFLCLGSYIKEESIVLISRDDGSFVEWTGIET